MQRTGEHYFINLITKNNKKKVEKYEKIQEVTCLYAYVSFIYYVCKLEQILIKECQTYNWSE